MMYCLLACQIKSTEVERNLCNNLFLILPFLDFGQREEEEEEEGERQDTFSFFLKNKKN